MALATILNGFLKYGQFIYGDTAVQIAQTLWYADVVLALLVAWAVPLPCIDIRSMLYSR